MENKEILTKGAEETGVLAGKFIEEVLLDREKRGRAGAVVVCLWGDLGAGKTTFVQGIGRMLQIGKTLSSPTFLIMKKYLLSGQYKGRCLYHYDAYRISNTEDILDLGWEEIIGDENNIVVVEWPEKIASILPSSRIDVRLSHVSENQRRINLSF